MRFFYNSYAAIVFFMIFALSANAQKEFKNSLYGFSMNVPEGWFEISKQQVDDNLDMVSKIDFAEKKRQELLKNHKNSFLLLAYTKYNPKQTLGYMPTLQVNVRPNPTKNFEDFVRFTTVGAETIQKQLSLEYEQKPQIMDLNGAKCVYFAGTFFLKDPNGNSQKIRSATYAIPKDNYLFQINFTDIPEKDINTDLFNTLIQSVRIK